MGGEWSTLGRVALGPPPQTDDRTRDAGSWRLGGVNALAHTNQLLLLLLAHAPDDRNDVVVVVVGASTSSVSGQSCLCVGRVREKPVGRRKILFYFLYVAKYGVRIQFGYEFRIVLL